MNNTIRCSLCDQDAAKPDVKHLALYVDGSEGIMACLSCRIILTEVARGMKHVAGVSSLAAWRRARQMVEAGGTECESCRT